MQSITGRQLQSILSSQKVRDLQLGPSGQHWVPLCSHQASELQVGVEACDYTACHIIRDVWQRFLASAQGKSSGQKWISSEAKYLMDVPHWRQRKPGCCSKGRRKFLLSAHSLPRCDGSTSRRTMHCQKPLLYSSV